jgi:thiol-disulfide isomerase/thioredoxin
MTDADLDADPELLAGTLVDGGVLVETDDGFGVAESFSDAVERRHGEVDALDPSAVEERVAGAVDDEDQRALVTDVGTDDREFLALFLALTDALPSVPAETRIRIVPFLQVFRGSPPRDEGAPDAFVPIHGDRMRTITRLFPRSVVYVWLDDCEPCDAMRETFDELLDGPPEGVELFAVYGPDSAEFLHEEYDVKGGPVTLFMLRDAVDSRYYGEKHERVIEKEIEILQESDPET